MNDIIFIGDRHDAETFRSAGIPSYAPPEGLLAERVLAEQRRCRVLAMTEGTFRALPAPLARELRAGNLARITIVPGRHCESDRAQIRALIGDGLPEAPAGHA